MTAKLLSQLPSTKQDRDAAKVELEKLRKKKFDAEKEESYIKQIDTTKDIFFKLGWKAACEKLRHGPMIEVFTTPSLYFLSDYMTSYAENIFKVLQEDKETVKKDDVVQKELDEDKEASMAK
ncbi:hypothetical protein CsSME_00035581 [Camellia sinensis var. sinensis]